MNRRAGELHRRHIVDAAGSAYPASKAEIEVKPRGWIETLKDACWAPEDELTAEDAASTLFEFFRSKHVADLRLIFKLAIILFSAVSFVMVVIAFATPVIHVFNHRESAFQIYDGAPGIIRHGITVLLTNVLPTLVASVGPSITVCGGIIAWCYLSATTRLGVVDLFACEIRTFCRVGTAFDIGKLYVEMHGTNAAPSHPAHSEGFVSNEEYFPVFASNSHDLEALEALVVVHITEFYTYMKAARDLQRKLAAAQSTSAAKSIIENLIYVLFLGYESARKAVKELVEFEPSQAESLMVILLTELICYSFLCKHFTNPKDQVRYARLTLRLDDYKRVVPAIVAQVEPHSDNDTDWGPAKRTLRELQIRYEDMLVTLRDLEGEHASTTSAHGRAQAEKSE